MAEQFYTLLTQVGKAKIANANVIGNKINFVKLKVGDGGGTYYNPTEIQTDIKNKVWEGNINSISVDENNLNWIVIETILPGSVGGFFIREAGIFDDEDNLIAIGKYPETYKPIASEGSSKDLIIRIILEVSNSDTVTLKIDPAVMIATKTDIKILQSSMNSISSKIDVHLADNAKHNSYVVATNIGNKYSVVVPNLTVLTDGYPLAVKFNEASTGAITLNINKLGDIKVVDYFGNQVTNVRKNLIANLRYEAVSNSFILLGKGGGGDATPDKVLAGCKYTSDTGPGVGTIPINGVINKQLGINETFNLPKGYIDGGQITQNIPVRGSLNVTATETPIIVQSGYYNGGTINAPQEYIKEQQMLRKYDKIMFNYIDFIGKNTPLVINEDPGTQYYEPETFAVGTYNGVLYYLKNDIYVVPEDTSQNRTKLKLVSYNLNTREIKSTVVINTTSVIIYKYIKSHIYNGIIYFWGMMGDPAGEVYYYNINTGEIGIWGTYSYDYKTHSIGYNEFIYFVSIDGSGINRYDLNTKQTTRMFNFNMNNAYEGGGQIQDSYYYNNNIYIIIAYRLMGGMSDKISIYKFNLATSTYSIIKNLSSSQGACYVVFYNDNYTYITCSSINSYLRHNMDNDIFDTVY